MPVLATTKRQRQLFYDHYTGKHALVSIPLTTVEFCCSRALLHTCLCWWELQITERIQVDGFTYTISILSPYYNVSSFNKSRRQNVKYSLKHKWNNYHYRQWIPEWQLAAAEASCQVLLEGCQRRRHHWLVALRTECRSFLQEHYQCRTAEVS